MKTKGWLGLFFIDATLHLVTTVNTMPFISMITKPLLMVLLGGYFLSQFKSNSSQIKYWVIAALVGSWFGDTFLMFQGHSSLFFLLGLSSFLLAHLAYTFAFLKFENRPNKWVFIVISLLFFAYSVVLAYTVWPGLGAMKIPVLVYALVLTIMGITGVIKNYGANNMIVIGVVLFIISDSLIAYTKFAASVENSRFLIMLTYILAQFLIIKGLSKRMVKIYS